MSDSSSHLRLKNLVFWGRHGHHPFEQESGNRFEVDVDIEVDLISAIATDDLAESVDLSAVFALVRKHVEGEPCSLIEVLADRIAVGIVGMHRVHSVIVKVRKMSPPLPGAAGGVMEAEVHRVP